MGDLATPAMGGVGVILAPIIPIAIGGVATYFKIFITSKDQFRNRTRLKRVDLRERVASKLSVLLQRVRGLGPDEVLRGDGRENADLIGEYTDETFRTFTIYHRLSVLDTIIRVSYLVLYLSILAGIGGFFCAWLAPPSRVWILACTIGVVAIQALVILGVQLASWKLDEYEDVT